MFTTHESAEGPAAGIAADALATAVLDRLVTKGFLTEAAAKEIVISAAHEVGCYSSERPFSVAADQLRATADTFSTQDLRPSITIRRLR